MNNVNRPNCVNCAKVGLESSCLPGKLCNNCGCAPGRFPPSDIAGWSRKKISTGDASIPNTIAWHKANGNNPLEPLTKEHVEDLMRKSSALHTAFRPHIRASFSAKPYVHHPFSYYNLPSSSSKPSVPLLSD